MGEANRRGSRQQRINEAEARKKKKAKAKRVAVVIAVLVLALAAFVGGVFVYAIKTAGNGVGGSINWEAPEVQDGSGLSENQDQKAG